MSTFICTLNCEEKGTPALHMRPAVFLVKLCNWFPLTDFKIYRVNEPPEASADPKSITSLVMKGFQQGEQLVVEVAGQCHVLASTFVRIVLQNLTGYSDDTPAVTARLTSLIDDAFLTTQDPDLDASGAFDLLNASRQGTVKQEVCRCVVAINDRLHALIVSLLPEVAKYFNCTLELLFEVTPNGIYSFIMSPEDGFALDYDVIFGLRVEIGTRITVVARGHNCAAALKATAAVLTHLWQCDNWLRTQAKPQLGAVIVEQLLAFSQTCSSPTEGGYRDINNPYLSNLLAPDCVFIGSKGSHYSKKDALGQLTAIHVRKHNLDLSELQERLQDADSKEPVVFRDGFLLVHATMNWSPRLSVSFGVYHSGIVWDGVASPVKLVCLVIFAKDTYGTWRDCLQKLGILFHNYPGLQGQLISTGSGDEFCAVFRQVESIMTK